MQKDGGRFATVQLVSNTPLSAKEALAVRDGHRPAPEGARVTAGTGGEGRPSAAEPTAGEPTGPSVGRQPEKNTRENTTQPTGPARESADEAPDAAGARGVADGEEPVGLAAAEALLLSLGRIDPMFAVPVRTARRWAPLAAKWLESGLSLLRIRNLLTEGLDNARKPLGAMRWRLEHALPEVPPPPQSELRAATPRQEPRTTRMRECRTRHTQPRLFTPPAGSDEELCADCRAAAAPEPAPQEPSQPSTSSGYTAFVEARRAKSSASPELRAQRRTKTAAKR